MDSIWYATRPAVPPAADPFPEGAQLDTVIAGAGLTGLVTAVLLARAGQRVAVVEARRVGAVTTGHTTGKLSLLQGLALSGIATHHSAEVVAAYVTGNREGQAWLRRFMDERAVPYQQRDAYTYVTSDDGVERLRREFAVEREAGLAVEWTDETELPFGVRGTIRLADQAQLHPLLVLDALLAELAERGGALVEDCRVTDADARRRVVVTTERGRLAADRLVLATGTPFLDRGGYFAKLTAHRSYVTTFRVPGPIPQGMYLSADEPTRSLRTVPAGDGEQLMVGGNGHVAGRFEPPTQAHLDDLRRWTTELFPGAVQTHAWSAQDYRSVNRVPFVGLLPRGGGSIYVATGYDKWGMTNATAAGLRLSAEILGGSMPWADELGRRVTKPAGLVGAVLDNAQTAVEAAAGWVGAELRALPDEPPAHGEGQVGRGADGRPQAVSTVDGVTCALSAVCTHLGGIVRWNDAERSWDCPLHGSRFAADGTVLEGPAVADLEQR